MKTGVSKSTRTPRSYRKISEGIQARLLDTVADIGPGPHLDKSPADGDHGGVPALSAKRRLGAVSDSLPLKKARLSPPSISKANVEPTPLLQPQPRPLECPASSLLNKFVDPVDQRTGFIYSFVSEWLESVGSETPKRPRSDTYLYRLDHDPIPRHLTSSAPDMAYGKDATGSAVPLTPASYPDSAARSGLSESSRSSGKNMVENPLYRCTNLAANHIYMRNPYEALPEPIAALVDEVRKDRDSPGPSVDQVREDHDLLDLELGGREPEVETYFVTHVFPRPKASQSIKRSLRQPMSRHTVPSTLGSKNRISNPVPDLLYGYNRHRAFPDERHRAQLIPMGNLESANSQDLVYPFFLVKFEGDGSSGSGNLWVATNQCLGGSASCIHVVERLNHELRRCQSDLVQPGPDSSAAFSVAMNGTEARLYVSWKQGELDYYTRKVRSFLLQEPEHYIDFRRYVRNIIDWGANKRLRGIQKSLDCLLEGGRRRASEAAKARHPPCSDGSSSGGGPGKRGRARGRYSSRRGRGAGGRARSLSGRPGGDAWKWDGTYERWFFVNADGTITWAEDEEQGNM